MNNIKKLLYLFFLLQIIEGQQSQQLAASTAVLLDKIKKCYQQRVDLIKEHDKKGCLATIQSLQDRLEIIEKSENIIPSQEAQTMIIRNIATRSAYLPQKSLCKIDTKLKQFREKNHYELSLLERQITDLAQQLLENMPPSAKTKLQNLLKEYNDLYKKLAQRDPYFTLQRQRSIFDLLFI